ncbi:hypothetical protein DH2020_000377 [Rehmannia glutinosa]|uniref:Uncharacterized protein n=1 Tax=Rehmannia glutinosa TaxID=99300 RepID=A0ABR0XWQ9_REHGL
MGDRRYGVGSRGRSPSPRRPPPRSRDFGPPTRARDFGPPPRARDFSPPPRSRDFSPRPTSRDFSPPPRSRDFSPPPRSRDFSPPPRSRDFSPSRHRKYSPLHRRTEGYSREAETSRRIEKKGHFDRDFDLRAPRLSENDNRDRDRGVVGGRQYRSPRRIEERDNFDRGVVDGRQYRSPRRIEERDNFHRDDSKRTIRLPDYEGAGKSKYENGVSVGRSMRSYGEDSYRDGWSFTKFQPDNILDGPRKSDHLRVDDTKVTGSGGERDYYPHSRYSDSGRAGPLSVPEYLDCDKPVPLKYERGERMHSHSYTLHHGGVDDIPISNLSGGDGSSHMSSVASQYLNTDTDKFGYIHFQNELHLERKDGSLHDHEDHYFEKKNDGFPYLDGVLGTEERVGEEINQFKSGGNLLSSRGYLKRDSDYMVSPSQPRDYVSVSSGILREGFPGYSAKGYLNMPSHLMQRGNILASQPIDFDGYNEKMENMLPRGLGGQLDGTRSASRLYTGLREEKQGDQLFAEFGRSEIGSMSTRLNDAEEDYRDQHVSRTYVSNPTFNECSHKKPMRDDGLLDEYPFSQVQSTPDKLDASRLLHGRKLEPDMLGTGSSRFNYGIDGYGSVTNEEHYAEVDGGQWSHVERSDILQSRGYDTSFGRIYDSPRKTPALVDISLVEPSETRLRYKHVRDERLYEQDAGIRISADGNGARMIYNQVNVGDGIDHLKLSHKLKSSKSNYEETWRSLSDMANDHPTSSKFHPSHSFKPCKSDSRGIKNRLGPIPQKLHVSQRLVKKHKPPLKKRLAPAPLKKHAALPWLKNPSSNAKASVQDIDKSPHDHDGSQLEDHLPLAKPEPPEKSDDFKQLVQSAFFKFLKQINETPTKRKNYMEQGKAGSLKCIVCGRSVFYVMIIFLDGAKNFPIFHSAYLFS